MGVQAGLKASCDRSKPVVRVDRLELLGSKRDSEAGSGGFGGGSPSDEEVPF